MTIDAPNDLAEVHRAVLDHIEELGLAHFPSNLGLGSDKWPAFALWTDDENWKEFLAIAPRVGAKVVYTNLDQLSEDDLLDEQDEGAEAEAEALAAHLGQPFRLSVAYVSGIVVHLWMCETSWWRALLDEQAKSDELDDDAIGKLVEPLIARMAEEGWARRIAEDRRFYGAKRTSEQREAGYLILRDLLGAEAHLLDAPDSRALWPFRRACAKLMNMAGMEVDSVRAEVSDRALGEVPEMVAQIVAEHPDTPGCGYRLREQRARRLVADRYGMNIAAVTAEVARGLAMNA